MYALLLTKNSFPIIGQVAWLLGKMMEGIFFVLDKIASLYDGNPNIGVAIIVFTFIVYLLMLPLTFKQQKFSKLSAKMNPEIQAIQAKYKGNKDPEVAQLMTQETNAVYAKYGVSPMGTCGQLLIQFPILIALYRVIYAIPAYVPMIKDEFTTMINALMGIDPSSGLMVNPYNFMASNKFIQTLSGYTMFRKQFKPEFLDLQKTSLDLVVSNLMKGENAAANLEATKNTFIDVINRASSIEWTSLAEQFPQYADIINNTNEALSKYNMFLGVNIGYSPKDTIYSQIGIQSLADLFSRQADFSNASFWVIFVSLMIPILAALTQWIGVKLAPTAQSDNNNNQEENPMMSSMKTMNTVMPLMSAFFCFTLPAGMGLYWIVGAVIRSIQQVAINKYIDRMNIDELIEKNTAKYNEKLKKRGVLGQGINSKASTNTKFVNPYAKNTKTEEQKAKDIKAYENYLKKDKKNKTSGGSIASKANLVKDFNERNNK